MFSTAVACGGKNPNGLTYVRKTSTHFGDKTENSKLFSGQAKPSDSCSCFSTNGTTADQEQHATLREHGKDSLRRTRGPIADKEESAQAKQRAPRGRMMAPRIKDPLCKDSCLSYSGLPQSIE